MGNIVHRTVFPSAANFQPAAAGPVRPTRERRSEPARARDGAVAAPIAAPTAARPTAYDDAGALIRRLKKPVRDLLKEVRLGRAVINDAVLPVVDEIHASLEEHPTAFITLARIKAQNDRAVMHGLAVSALMINLGREIGLDGGSLRDLGTAGLLHDIGETALPATLLERPARLSPPELALVRSHTVRGHEHLAVSDGLPAVVRDVALHHHERVDGNGYPVGTSGPALSQEARIAAICDVYDAITSNRPHREAWTPPESLATMFAWSGHFDETLLSHFVRSVGIYPVGSLVRLASDHLGVVLSQNDDLTKPVVRVFYSIAGRTKASRRDLDLSRENGDAIVSREMPRKWGFLDWDDQWPKLLRLA